MSNKRIMMFVIALIVLIIGISAVSATDVSSNDTTTVTTTNPSDAATATATQSIAEDTSNVQTTDAITTSTTKKVTKDKTTTKTKTTTKEKSNGKNLKTEGFPETYIVTNTTFNQFFTNGSLNEKVNEGDTLDFQGAFHTTSTTNYTMVIDKPVNLISSTQNSNISLNTTSTDFFGKNPGDAFVITNGGSGTNITGLYFYNTQIFVRNAHNVTLKNLTVIDEYQVVGGGVGVLSVRENSSYVTVRDSYFRTENNGGHSTLVGAWVNHCIFDNNTIVGVGNIGNLIYLTSYNVDIVGNSTNDNNIISNNKIQGPAKSASICYGIAFCGCNNLIENNTVNYSRGGMGITIQWGSGTSQEGDSARKTVNNTYRNNVVNNCSSNIPANSTVVNNTFSEDVTLNSQVEAYNNTFDGVTLNGIVNLHDNVIGNITVDSTNNQATNYNIINNTVDNIIFTPSSGKANTENITIIGNIIKNNITVLGATTGNVDNVNITRNNITGTIRLGTARNHKISNVTITDNSIITNNTYAIELTQKSNNVTVTNNNLRSLSYYSDSTVSNKGTDNNIYLNLPLRTNTTMDLNSVDDVLYGNNVTITGILKDINGQAISGATISIEGKSLNTLTNNNGEFTLILPASSGSNVITVEYMGNITYNKASKDVKFNGLKHNTSITANITESNNITGVLKDVNGTVLPDTLITINIGNNTIQEVTDENGIYSHDISSLISNATSVIVVYDGDYDYQASNASIQLTVSKILTNLSVTARTSGQSVDITGVLKDANNIRINNATITIRVNNRTYTRTTDINGTYSLNITSLSSNTYNVSVNYNGDSKYQGTQTSTKFNITVTTSKIQTIVNVTTIHGIIGENTRITARFSGTDGKVLTSGKVAIKINGKTWTHENITNGVVSYTLKLDPKKFSAKNYSITFRYGGSSRYTDATANTTLTILKHTSKFNYTTTTAAKGTIAKITLKITDNKDLFNANNGTLGLKINGKTYKVNGKAVIVKPVNGIAVFNISTSNLQKNNNITFTYSGYREFTGKKQTYNNGLILTNQKTIVQTSVIRGIIGENANITARFIGADGKVLTSGKVAVKINGKTFGHANITNGIVSFVLKLDPKKFSAKNYTVTFKFGGKEGYTDATANTTLTILKHTSKLNYTTTTVRKGTTAKLTLKITDDKNTINANNGTVGLKINGKTYKVNGKTYTVKPVNGVATFNIPTSDLKTNNNITFTYSGYREFNGGRITINNGLIVNI